MSCTRCLLTAAGLLALTVSANAQPPGYRPPNSSPAYGWLGQGSATQRYLTNVRPMQNTQDALQNVQQQFDAFGRAAAQQRDELTAEGIRPTGRGATFQNLGHYYPPRTGVARPGGALGRR